MMKGRKAKYTVMVPQVAHNPGLSDQALQAAASGQAPIDHCYLDRDKWAHWPGGGPEAHDLLVIHADDSPEMDSHVKQLAREVGRYGMLPTVFAVKEGAKGPVSWSVDNPEFKQINADDAAVQPLGGDPALGADLHAAQVLRPVSWVVVREAGTGIHGSDDTAHLASPLPRGFMNRKFQGTWQIFMGGHSQAEVQDWMEQNTTGIPFTVVPASGGYSDYGEPCVILLAHGMYPARVSELVDALQASFPGEESIAVIPPGRGRSTLLQNPNYVGDEGGTPPPDEGWRETLSARTDPRA